jgi:Flp pilus assembly protein TadG
VLREFRRADSGAVLVEMTLVVPFLITLSAGVFEFSNAMHTRLLLEAGVEDAARYIARCYHSEAVKAGCETAAENLAVWGTVSVDGTESLRVTSCDPAWSTAAVIPAYEEHDAVDPDTGDRTYLSVGDKVHVVSVSTTCSYVGTGLLAYLGFSPLTLSASHQERVLGW